MKRDIQTARADTPLKEVAATLSRHRISGLPIVDEEGRVLGVVSETDILRKEEGHATEDGGLIGWLLEPPEPDIRLEARTAGEAMTSPPVTIDPRRPVAEAAGLMVERGINRLRVVLDDRLVGIVTRADLVGAFHRSDEEIEREIAEDVVLHTLWIAPEGISVTVSQGEVSLAGRLDTRTEAELVAAYVRRLPASSASTPS